MAHRYQLFLDRHSTLVRCNTADGRVQLTSNMPAASRRYSETFYNECLDEHLPRLWLLV